MRNRLKAMLKNEKGFTLVELLAVLVILGIVVAIAIPAIGNVINNAQKDADEATKTMIVDAARLYEIQEYDGEPEDFDVTVQVLLDAGYLDLRQGEDDEDENEILKGYVIREGTDENGNGGKLVFRPENSDPDDDDEA